MPSHSKRLLPEQRIGVCFSTSKRVFTYLTLSFFFFLNSQGTNEKAQEVKREGRSPCRVSRNRLSRAAWVLRSHSCDSPST